MRGIAEERATGNDRDAAVALAVALLPRPWTAQITEVRVERAGGHAVAGITQSGVKLRRAIDPPGFLREANAIVDLALQSSDVEEVDLRAVVPLAVGAGTVTSPDFAHAVERTVFTLTVRRDRPGLREPYWNPVWRAGLATSSANRRPNDVR